MVGMRKQPDLFSRAAEGLLKYVEACAKAAREKGIMAIALADDIAGNNGLLFSFDYFANSVYPVYAAAVDIIKENGLFASSTRTATCEKCLSFSFRQAMTVSIRWTCRAASTSTRCG